MYYNIFRPQNKGFPRIKNIGADLADKDYPMLLKLQRLNRGISFNTCGNGKPGSINRPCEAYARRMNVGTCGLRKAFRHECSSHPKCNGGGVGTLVDND